MQGNNCHFYRRYNYCTVLKEMVCTNGKCTFFKTTKEYKEALKKYPVVNYAELYKSRHKNDAK